MAIYSNSVALSGHRLLTGVTLAAERTPSMPALDWIGIVTLFGIAVSINWWVVKSYSDRMERRLEKLEGPMLGLVADVSLIKGAMGIYPGAKAKAGSGE